MPFADTVPESMRECGDAWSRLHVQYDEIAKALSGCDRTKTLTITSTAGTEYGDIELSEYADKFPLLNWSLVEKVSPNGGVGATENLLRIPGDYTSWYGANTRILRAGILGYDALDGGLTFLAMHEPAHATVLGMTMNKTCWDEHEANEPNVAWGMTSGYWKKNEIFANDVALAVAAELGIVLLNDPNPSYLVKDHIPLAFLDPCLSLEEARKIDR